MYSSQLLIIAIIFFTSTKLWASDVGLNELLMMESLEKPRYEEPSLLDNVRLHGGLKFVNSLQEYSISPRIKDRGPMRGMSLNFGVDLFSEYWLAQGILTSFPEAEINGSHLSSNAFELRIDHVTKLLSAVTLRVGAGLAHRLYSIKRDANPKTGEPSSEKSFSSGATALAAGLDYWISPQLSLELEVGHRIPLASGDDPTSWDLGTGLSGHF